jgi:hypothetical protein
MDAFTYPAEPHVRRHGPQGYAGTESFRPWLRDEFSFRCVYCLLREQWGLVPGVFDIDHFLAVVSRPDKTLKYDNLLYCCTTCNGAKGKRRLPNPENALLAIAVQVHDDGSIKGSTPRARRLIRVLGLNDAEYIEFRMLWLDIVSLARECDAQLYERLMGFPADLPNLASLRPPKGNTRPQGVQQSYFAHRHRGTLPTTY